MSKFNEYFRNTGAKMIVNRFFKDVDKYSKKTITKLNYRIDKIPDQPASFYIENNYTATFKVIVEYELDNDGNMLYTEFECPREIDGCFVLEGAYRINSNTLGLDFNCRIQTTGTGNHQINFDYDRKYDVNKKILRIKNYNPDLGKIEGYTEIRYENIDAAIEDPKLKEKMKLTELQTKKFEIKLDLDYKPEYITKKLIDDCLAFGDDRLKDLIIDKTIESVSKSFTSYLFKDGNGSNLYYCKRNIQNHFTKHGRLPEPCNVITNLCNKFFRKGRDQENKTKADGDNYMVPPGINAVNLEAYKSRIQVMGSVAINTTHLDLIDVGDTPINGNVNKQNSLTVSTHLIDSDSPDCSGILFDVLDKDFNVITIDYYDYLNSKVCASEYVDYDKKELKPNDKGEVEVKYRMKRKMIPVSEIDLIDRHPDYRLSTTTRRIPFINYTDSVRVHMGTSMLKQSIPIANAQRPLVDSGNYDDLENNIMNEKFQGDEGVVKDITKDDVIIELPSGEETYIRRRTAMKSQNDVSIYTEPKVKIGQKVKKGDVICGAHEVEKDTVKSGVNALVLFHAYHGLVNEDAVVISESFAKRIMSYSIIDLSIDVMMSNKVKWIAPIGTKVASLDSVVTLYKVHRLDEINQILSDKLKGLADDSDLDQYNMAEQNLIVPNNIEEAIVSDVLIQENTSPKKPDTIKDLDRSFAKSSQDYLDNYKKEMNRDVIYRDYPEYVASDTLTEVDMSDKSYKTVYTIRVRLIKNAKAVVGEKITSRYGGKGVCSAIIPDASMPIVNIGGKKLHAEVIMNPYSTINRKIPAILMETGLSGCALMIHEKVEELKKTPEGRKQIMPLLEHYYGDRFKGMNVTDFIKLHNNSPMEDLYNFRVGSYSKFTPDTVQKFMDELGVPTEAKIQIPEADVTDWKELESVLTPTELEQAKADMAGKFVTTDKPLSYGYVYLERLYHQPQYSGKVVSDMSDVSSRGRQPISGRGLYRKGGGQKLSEMDVWAILARNAKPFLKSAREDQNRELQQRFLDNILGLGLMLTDKKGYGQGGSNLKSNLQALRDKLRNRNLK